MTDRTDLLQRIGRVGSQIDPGLTDGDVERLVEGSRQRRRRKLVTRACVTAAVAGAAALAVLWSPPNAPIQAPAGPSIAAPALVAPGSSREIRFSDGSVATALDPQSVLAVVEDAPARISLDLGRGRQRFDVVPRPARSFVVRAGAVSVTVVGTVFSVERVADRVGVTVERGRVLVDWRSGSRTLSAGEGGWFPPLVVGDRVPPSASPVTRERARPAIASRRLAAATEVGRATAPASVDVTPAPAPAPVETAESLLAAADSAREAGRSDEGAALLRRLLARHRRDPRAPLAAFTLGRVLLMELNRPREAAAAFAEVRALAPAGPFAEDALAREVEALRKAGADGEARQRAREYLRLYPGGSRAQAVKALGGAE
jgi:transmembrane sensor